jgi:glycine oxidase
VADDVIVIGGGLIGCLCALRLQERGLRTRVLDRSLPLGESSWAAGGILAPQAEAASPGPAVELGLRSRSLYPALAEELREATGIDVGLDRTGVVHVADSAAEHERLEACATWQRAAGLPVETIGRREISSLEPQLGGFDGGLFFPAEYRVDPRRLGRAVEVAAAARGVRFDVAGVRRILSDDAGDGRLRVLAVETEAGDQIATRRVVLAAGAWSSRIAGCGLRADCVRPVRGQIVLVDARPLPIRHVVYGAGGYLVPRADRGILCGSTSEEVGYHKAVTVEGAAGILATARRLVPALGGASIVDSWSGLRPASADELPILGRSPGIDGLVVATGHFRNGVLLAPVTAEIVARMVAVAEAEAEAGNKPSDGSLDALLEGVGDALGVARFALDSEV